MPADVYQMMKDLTTFFENKPPPTKAIPTVRITPSLATAQMYRAISDYLGPTLVHLVIRKGDQVIIYAKVEGSQVGIGYSIRTQTGRFPTDVVEWTQDKPEISDELVVRLRERSFLYQAADQLMYKKGDYIRVCRWDSSRRNGYGLNQRTWEWGYFQYG
jgi:hypothetical protein